MSCLLSLYHFSTLHLFDLINRPVSSQSIFHGCVLAPTWKLHTLPMAIFSPQACGIVMENGPSENFGLQGKGVHCSWLIFSFRVQESGLSHCMFIALAPNCKTHILTPFLVVEQFSSFICFFTAPNVDLTLSKEKVIHYQSLGWTRMLFVLDSFSAFESWRWSGHHSYQLHSSLIETLVP